MPFLSSTRSYGTGVDRHQWDAGTPLRFGLPLLLLATAAITTGAAAIIDAALDDIGWNKTGDARFNGAFPDRTPPLLLLRDLAPKEALAINRGIPFAAGPNPAAKPFLFKGDSQAYFRALTCLAAAIYYEAGAETVAGKHAVAQVVLNRVRHPAFADGICGVVYEGSTRSTGCQFTFTCDGSLARRPRLAGWRDALTVARAALSGSVYSRVGYATHYHADYVVPYWVASLAKNAVIGAHIFYRWPDGWGRPGAFDRGYRGLEPDPLLLGAEALRASALADFRTVNLTPESDPRVELASIVDYLAHSSGNPEQSSGYRHHIHTYFEGYADHLAVQIYRQMASGEGHLTLPQLAEIAMHHSPPPAMEPESRIPRKLLGAVGGKEALAALITALRDFAAHSNFQKFWDEQQPIYAALAQQVEVEVQVPPAGHTPRVILAPLMKQVAVPGCGQPRRSSPTSWLVVALDSFTGDNFQDAFKAASDCGAPAGQRVARSGRGDARPEAS